MANKKSSGNRNLVLYLAIYFFTWLGGLIAVLLAKDDKSMKFHGLQALVLGIIIVIIGFVPFVKIISFLLWIYGLYIGYEAGKGNDIEIPVIGDLVKPYA
ncbi:MAG: hypothetical protein ACP5SJ_02095 [Candidatus Micrarchaeia archaeon]